MPDHPIFTAVRAFDVEALRRELAAGVDPDMYESDFPEYDYSSASTPLCQAVYWASGCARERIQERLECIAVLLEAGASVDKQCSIGETPLFKAAGVESPTWTVVIAALLEAGADVNYVSWSGSVLAKAAKCGTAGAVKMLISAGAVDLDRALVLAIEHGKQRSCAPLMRAGAAIPAVITAPKPACSTPWEELVPTFSQTRAYVERVRATGGFKAYEKAHRQHLTAIFLPKFPAALPIEILERVLEFTWDIGGH